MTLRRRIRGIFGTAMAWGALWMVGTFPVFLLVLGDLPLWRWLSLSAQVALSWGRAGAATGATYALLVIASERHGRLASFRMTRAALLGGTAGAAYVLATVSRVLEQIGSPPLVISGSVVLGALLGGLTASLTLVAARRSPALSDHAEHAEIAAPVPND